MSLDMPPIPLPEEGSHMLSDDAIEVPEFEDREETAASKLGDSSGSLRLRLEGSPPGQPQNAALPSPVEPATVYSTPAPPTTGSTTSYWSARSWLPPLFNNTPVAPTTLISAQESLISSLREELALQQSITTQYAADLDSRDEFIDILCARVEVAETELEEACTVEEEQYELIRAFRKQLGSLERAVGRINVDGNLSRQEVQSLRSNQSADGHADESQVLRLMEERDELLEEVARLQRARNDDQEGWNEEKFDLLTKLGEAEAADSSTKSQTPARGNGNRNLTENDREQMRLLQEELEAQWERTEKASEELRVLRKENAELKAAVTTLQEKNGEGEDFEELESTNQELANQLNDVLAAQQALEEERDQVSLSPLAHCCVFYADLSLRRSRKNFVCLDSMLKTSCSPTRISNGNWKPPNKNTLLPSRTLTVSNLHSNNATRKLQLSKTHANRAIPNWKPSVPAYPLSTKNMPATSPSAQDT
jgi:hypothetical protein